MQTLTNPIENTIQSAINSSNQISIAVPFLSYPIVKRLFKSEQMEKIQSKRIIIKLDDSHSISYDLAAIKHLLELGFNVRFENTIHLKLYILGEQIFISSGNLTDGGLINNFELTVQTTQQESHAESIFEKIWEVSQFNKVTLEYVSENWDKYLFLKRKFPSEKTVKTTFHALDLSATDENLIDFILHYQKHWQSELHLIELVNKRRHKLFDKLKEKGFDQEYFYAPVGNKNREKSLFYQFVYGNEGKLAGTGLREDQFKDVFTSSKFKELLFHLYPQYKSNNSWNFSSEEDTLNFCKGLFAVKIRSFKETMPVRLANFFYPETFLPVFNLNHLSEMCFVLGFESSSNEPAIKLFEYNRFLNDRLKNIPYSNYIKSTILYRLLYTMMVKREIDKNGIEGISNFIMNQKRGWIRKNMENGLKLIHEMKITTK